MVTPAEPVTEQKAQTDIAHDGVYHFLDVGGSKYGECTLVEFGDVRILIDGSHQQDFVGQRGYPSIPDQLKDILGSPPHDILLIIVTHCHADHFGCLPELVSNDILRPRFALLTDPRLGFGRMQGENPVSSDSPRPGDRLAALLREEDASDLTDDELYGFIDAVASVETRYNAFVQNLADKGVDVSIHRGGPLKPELAAALKPTGASLFGPSEAQLLLCAQQIWGTNKEGEDAAADFGPADQTDIAQLYRVLVGKDEDVSRNSRGNGMNCQSITFAFGPANARVLLAGDMQFTEPGVAGMDEEIAALRQAVVAAGPYKLFKATHHTSHNGQDDAFLDAIGSPPLIVHSGGLRDEAHPFPGVLKFLKARHGIAFARTDRNGRITVRPDRAPEEAFDVSKGSINDFTPNIMPDEMEPSPGAREPIISGGDPPPQAGPQIIIVNLPPGPVDMTIAGIDIKVRPRDSGAMLPPLRNEIPVRVSIPPRSQRSDGTIAAANIAPGRSIAKLLFVTDPDRLAANIGRSEAQSALWGIAAQGAELLTGEGARLLKSTQKRLKDLNDREGLILLGGYDVVPPGRRDVLDAPLRHKLGNLVSKDADQFWVWSDASYGDLDDDGLAELPVSRVPDARDARLFLNALSAPAFNLGERFGIHNIARPFAIDVWQDVPGTRDLNVSEFFAPTDIVADHMAASCHYYMLHGADSDATSFVGEDAAGTDYPLAFAIKAVPRQFCGMVFSGCCWSALIVRGKAVDSVAKVPPPRMAEESIALAYLKAGASAFIGCTGSHYSGKSVNPAENYAAQLHSAFWRNLATSGGNPSLALFGAKREYAEAIVASGNRLDPQDTARRLKNLAQFTCLGLGW